MGIARNATIRIGKLYLMRSHGIHKRRGVPELRMVVRRVADFRVYFESGKVDQVDLLPEAYIAMPNTTQIPRNG